GGTIMDAREFDIIVRGDIVLGHHTKDVKQRLQQLVKVDATRVHARLTGRLVALKRGLDEATADEYRAVLLKGGAQVEVGPSTSAYSSFLKSTPRESMRFLRAGLFRLSGAWMRPRLINIAQCC